MDKHTLTTRSVIFVRFYGEISQELDGIRGIHRRVWCTCLAPLLLLLLELMVKQPSVSGAEIIYATNRPHSLLRWSAHCQLQKLLRRQSQHRSFSYRASQ